MSAEDLESRPAVQSLTAILNDHSAGGDGAFGRWIKLVYADLRRIAARQMCANLDQPLLSVTESPTAIASDAVLKLLKQQKEWRNREHFFGVATLLIGYIVRDYRDKRTALKRGSGNRGGSIDVEVGKCGKESPEAAATIFEGIESLSEGYPRQAEVVSLHIFANNPLPQVAEMIGVSIPTVERDWRFAKAWLKDFLTSELDDGHDS